MGKKKKEQDEGPSGPPGAPEWVVTFTDMISLLVTFFVLLMTFSSMEVYEVLKVDSFLSGDKGVLESKQSSLVEMSEDEILTERDILRGSRNPHSRPTESLAESLDEMGQKKTGEHLEMDLNRIADGLIIEFDEQASFAPASATVSRELAESLGEIGRVLEHYPHMVVVEGFTDGNFTSSPSYGSPEELSFARAESAARTLARESNLSNAVLQLAGHGANYPRADNVSASGRRLNRRVQLRVLSMSKIRAGYLESRRKTGEEEG